MKKYLITYELKNKSRDYTSFYSAIKDLGTWWHYLEDVWIIKSSTLSADQISKKLLPLVDKTDDYLFVIKVDTTDKQGWLTKDAWDWLNS